MTQTQSVAIDRPWQEVCDFLAQPLNFNRWASGLGNSLRLESGVWLGEGPAGPITLRFSEPNTYGVADHWVGVAPGVEVYVPLRVVASGEGCEVMLTLFRQPGMSDAQFQADSDWVARDLASLKQLLEA